MKVFMVSSTLLIVLVLLLRYIFKGKVRASLIYALWGVVLLRLLVPVQILPMPSFLGELAVLGQETEQQKIDSDEVEVVDAKTGEVYIVNTWTDTMHKKEVGESYVSKMDDNVDEYGYLPKAEEDLKSADTSDSVDLAQKESGASSEVASKKNTLPLAMILKMVWASVAGLMFLVILISNVHLYRKIKRNRVAISSVDKPHIYQTDCVPVPCLYGLFRPTIYLTEEATQKGKEELDYIICHEKMHYRHLDFVWSVLRSVLVCVYWFHPMVWVAAKVSRQDAEYAADEAVIQNLEEEERIAYGKTILSVLKKGENQNLFSIASAVCSSKKELKKRMLHIAMKKRTSLDAVVVLVAVMLLVTACSFAGKQVGNSGESPNSETTNLVSDSAVEESNLNTELGGGDGEPLNREILATNTEEKALDEAIEKAVKEDFAPRMATDSSWAYHNLEYENLVESHMILAKEEKGNEVTVYLDRYVVCYGVGAPEGVREKHYGVRAGLAGYCSITFEKKENTYEMKEFWEPESGENYMKSLQEKFPDTVSKDDLDEIRYIPNLKVECQQKALEYIKQSEKAGTKEDVVGLEKINETVSTIEIYTPNMMARCEYEDKPKFVQKIVDAYNQMVLVPVTNLEENSMDLDKVITINFEFKYKNKSRQQIIFDGERKCWINGKPYTLMMDTEVFDYNEITSFVEKQAYYKKLKDPYGMGVMSIVDYENDMMIMNDLLSDETDLVAKFIQRRAKKMSIINGVSYYEEYNSEMKNFIMLKKQYLLAKELGIAATRKEAEKTAKELKQTFSAMGIEPSEYCKRYDISMEKYWQYFVKWCRLTSFDYDLYIETKNISEEELPAKLNEDLQKYDVKVLAQ